jgi:hypothetical protein
MSETKGREPGCAGDEVVSTSHLEERSLEIWYLMIFGISSSSSGFQ